MPSTDTNRCFECIGALIDEQRMAIDSCKTPQFEKQSQSICRRFEWISHVCRSCRTAMSDVVWTRYILDRHMMQWPSLSARSISPASWYVQPMNDECELEYSSNSLYCCRFDDYFILCGVKAIFVCDTRQKAEPTATGTIYLAKSIVIYTTLFFPWNVSRNCVWLAMDVARAIAIDLWQCMDGWHFLHRCGENTMS